ncbi:MAG: metallophosphoesterase N-terminal domain-containing protein, partial [Proteiniphilum sp.]
MKKNVFTLILIFISVATYSQQFAKGYVYEDVNKNGQKDRREAGIAEVAVSNGTEVVLTDDKGFYTLPLNDGNTIFVIKPGGYKTPVDDNFIPQFFYHHKPEGSPDSLTYKGVPPTGKLPESVDFALYKQNEPENFSAVVFGDPQPYSIQDMDYFTQKIVQDVKKKV